MITKAVKEFIETHNYETYVIAYSGGVDSQVLLHAFSQLVPERVMAYHVNHGISSHAQEWEDFCSNHASQWKVKFAVSHFSLANESNLEDVARRARYGAFASVMTQTCALVTGHHLDDQAETFFLNLMRGAGIDGLSSMPEKKSFAQGVHLRPFLQFSKTELKAYALEHNLMWVEDESNEDSSYDRNFIRNEVMPLLKSRWKQAATQIGTSVKHIQEAKEYIDTKTPTIDIQETNVELDELVSLEPYEQVQVVRKWVKFHVGQQASQSLIDCVFDTIIPARDDAKMKWEQKDYFITRYNKKLYLVKSKTQPCSVEEIIQKANLNVNADTITVRSRVNGAKIKVAGGFHKEVKKIFQEIKVPTWERDNLVYLYDNETLVSVGGLINNPDYLNA